MTSEATRTAPRNRTTPASKGSRPGTGGRPGTAERRAAIETAAGRFEFAAHNCFGCGTLNAGGLGLALHVEPGRSWTLATLDRRFEGWEGIIHGGILCAILDEVMAWALVGEDNWGVTARMAVEFRRPVEVGTVIRAEGWTTRTRRRLVETSGHILDAASGMELATATGVYVAAGTARKRDLQARYAFRVANETDAVETAADASDQAASIDPLLASGRGRP